MRNSGKILARILEPVNSMLNALISIAVDRHQNVTRLHLQRLILAGCACSLLLLTGCSSSDSEGGSVAGELDGGTLPWRLASVQITPIQGAGDIARYSIIYDSDGLSVGETVDADSDGQIDERFVYLYANGKLVRSDLDSDLDGITDSARYFNYDDTGLLVNESIDDGTDQSINRVINYNTVDSTKIVANFDDDNDGIVDTISRFTRDQTDRLSTVEFDNNADGLTDVVDTLVYASDGRVVGLDRVSVASGQTLERWDFTYEIGLCVEPSNHQPRRYVCIAR